MSDALDLDDTTAEALLGAVVDEFLGRLDRSETARRVREAVAGLPEADREVLLMRNFEGLSNQEVAYLLGLDPATASKRHGRALLRLRQALLDGGLAEPPP